MYMMTFIIVMNVMIYGFQFRAVDVGEAAQTTAPWWKLSLVFVLDKLWASYRQMAINHIRSKSHFYVVRPSLL
jgi:hypothetical protein